MVAGFTFQEKWHVMITGRKKKEIKKATGIKFLLSVIQYTYKCQSPNEDLTSYSSLNEKLLQTCLNGYEINFVLKSQLKFEKNVF